jgi:hypothetical protein
VQCRIFDVRTETHIKHAIGFVQNQELDVFHAQATTLDQIHQSSRGCHQQIATTLDLTELFSDFSTTVNTDGSDTGGVGETTSFFIDLLSELAGRSHDQSFWIYLATTVIGGILSTVAEHGHDDWKEETSGFTTTGLGTGHQITTSATNGTRILLDRSGSGVTTELSVAVKILTNGLHGILLDGIGSVLSGNFDRDFVVVVEVDSGSLVVVTSKEGSFQTGVGLRVPVESTFVFASATPASVVTASSAASVASAGATSGVNIAPARVLTRFATTATTAVTAAVTTTVTASSAVATASIIAVASSTTVVGVTASVVVITSAASATGAVAGLGIVSAAATALRVSQMRWHIFSTLIRRCCR